MTVEVTAPELIPPPPTEADAPPDEYSHNGTTPLRRVNGHKPPRGPRVPPHDLAVERAMLGACLYAPAAMEAAANAGLGPEDFYAPVHAAIYATITDLRQRDQAVDAVTVAAHCDASPADMSLGDYLTALIAECPATTSAPTYAADIAALAYRRRIIGVSADMADAAYDGTALNVDSVVERLTPPVSAATTIFEDMQAIMDTNPDPVIPSLAPRDDHATCLLYAPGINWLSGEPGKGKSILARWWAAQELLKGNTVLWLDFEATREATVAYFRQMGVTDVTRLVYTRRHEGWDVAGLTQVRAVLNTRQPTIVVFDAVAGAMEAEGLDPESNTDVERWVAALPSQCFAAGAAVICVDHVVKKADDRGRWMIGAQRKMARADVAYGLDMFEEAGEGKTGRGKLVVNKDRYGALGKHQGGKTIATVAIISEGDDELGYELRVSLGKPDGPAMASGSGPTWYMEQVSRVLEDGGQLTVSEIRKRIGRTVTYVDAAVKRLKDMGHIEAVAGKGAAKPYRLITPYRQPDLPPPAVDTRYEVDRDDA